MSKDTIPDAVGGVDVQLVADPTRRMAFGVSGGENPCLDAIPFT
jgi:hypothetical protein